MRASEDVVIEYKKRPVQPPFAAGEIQISFHQNLRAGQCIYTHVINTELGAGRHGLTLYLIDELGMDESPLQGSRILYGDSRVFQESSYIPAVPQVKLAAYLEENTGCFQIGVQFIASAMPGSMTIGWQARKEELLSEKEQEVAKAKAFYIVNPPKLLRPGMKYTFRCQVTDNLAGRVHWEVLGEEAGTIDRFGMYTAPQKQGVFEVQASLEGTECKATAYVIVKE